MTYKIGDKIRILDNAGDHFFCKGEEGVIINQDGDGDFWAHFPMQNDHWCIGDNSKGAPYKFELVE